MKSLQLSLLSILAWAMVSPAASPLQFTNISVVIGAPPNDLFAVAHDGVNRFVAVGARKQALLGRFFGSQPFITNEYWTATTASGPAADLLSVAASSNLFVASGDKNIFFTSTSGTDFSATIRAKIFTTRADTEGIAFNDNSFVAVARAPQISRVGYNGATLDLLGPNNNKWQTAGFIGLSYAESFRDVAPIEGGFVACGAFGVVRKSVNGGRTWELLRPGGTREPTLLGIVSHENVIVAVGKPGTGRGGAIVTSSDGGRIWSRKPAPGPLFDVAHTGSEFVAVGKGGLVLISSNGLDWAAKTTVEVQSDRDLNGLTFVTNGFLKGIGIVVGAKGANGATVLLAGVAPQMPEVVTNREQICAGDYSPIVVGVETNAGSGVVLVEWMDASGRLITNGFRTNEWKFVLTTNLSTGQFTLLPELFGTNNLVDPNQKTVLNFKARAVDIRTGFVSETNDITLEVFPRPTAEVSGSTNICNGQPVSILADLTGLGPWDIVWSVNGANFPLREETSRVAQLLHTPDNLNPNAATSFVYRVVSLVDKGSSPLNCAANALSNDLRGVANVINYPRPTGAVISTNTSICNGQAVQVRAQLSGLGPWEVIWSRNGVELPVQNVPSAAPVVFAVLTNIPNSASLNSAVEFTYAISRLTDKGSPLNCVALSGDLSGTSIATNFPRPTASVSGSTNICDGESAIIFAQLTGLGPWQIAWASNGVILPSTIVIRDQPVQTIAITQAPPSLDADALSHYVYVVTNLVDLGSPLACAAAPALDFSGQAQITVAPRPTIALSGATNICNGQSASIPFQLTGIGPWEITWASNGFVLPPRTNVSRNAALIQAPTNPNPDSVTVHEYSVSNLVDLGTSLNCLALPTNLGASFMVTNLPRPTATLVSADAVLCNGDTNVLQVNLTGLFPLTIRWQDGVQQTSNSYVITRAAVPVNPSLSNILSTNYWVASVVSSNVIACRGDQVGDIQGTNLLTINPRAGAAVVTTNTICNGLSATLRVNLSGRPPWNIVWSDGQEQTNILTSPVFRDVTPVNNLPNSASTNLYTVTSISDSSGCPSQPGDITGVGRIIVNPLPTAAITSGDATIDSLQFKPGNGHTNEPVNITNKVTVAFTGVGPWNVKWLVQEGPDFIAAISKTYTTNPATTEFVVPVYSYRQVTGFTFAITNLATGVCPGETNGLVANLYINPPAGAIVSGTTNICYGMPATVFANLLGKGPWTNITWSDGFVITNSSSPVVERTLAAGMFSNLYTVTNYTITNLLDSRGAGTNFIGTAQITVYPVATNPPVSLGNVTNCAGATAELKVSVADGFTVDWFADAPQTSLLLSGSTNLSVISGAGTNVYYAAVRFAAPDATNSVCYAPSSTGVTNVVLPVPSSGATNLGHVTNCVGVATQLVVSVSSGFTVDWFADDARTQPLAQNSTTLQVSASEAGTTNYYAATRATNALSPVCYFPNNTVVTHVATTNCSSLALLDLSPDSTPVLSIIRGEPGLLLQWHGDYVLEKCTDLAAGQWATVASGTAGALNTHNVSGSSVSQTGSGFFRLVPGKPQ